MILAERISEDRLKREDTRMLNIGRKEEEKSQKRGDEEKSDFFTIDGYYSLRSLDLVYYQLILVFTTFFLLFFFFFLIRHIS